MSGSKIILQKWVSLWSFNLIFGGLSLSAIAFCTKGEDFSMTWSLSLMRIIGFLLVMASLAAMGLFIGMLLDGKDAYSLFIFVIALVQAFLAGGLVPSAFLPEAINKLGYLTYNKYATHLLGGLLGVEPEIQYYCGGVLILVVCLIGCHIIIRKRGIRL